MVLSDSTHGDMSHFGLVTVRIHCDGGHSGMGYTYCVGDIGGPAIHSLVERDLAVRCCSARTPARVEDIWERMWWRLHFVGRGGIAAFAIAAVDIALWDLRARGCRRAVVAFSRVVRDPRVDAYAGGIDLQFTPRRARGADPKGFLEAGFRAIKMKVGRDRCWTRMSSA